MTSSGVNMMHYCPLYVNSYANQIIHCLHPSWAKLLKCFCGGRKCGIVPSICQILSRMWCHCGQCEKGYEIYPRSAREYDFRQSYSFWSCNLFLSVPALHEVQASSKINDMFKLANLVEPWCWNAETRLIWWRIVHWTRWNHICSNLWNIDGRENNFFIHHLSIYQVPKSQVWIGQEPLSVSMMIFDSS